MQKQLGLMWQCGKIFALINFFGKESFNDSLKGYYFLTSLTPKGLKEAIASLLGDNQRSTAL